MIQLEKKDELLFWKIQKRYDEDRLPIYNQLYDKRYEKPIFEYIDYPDDNEKYHLKNKITFIIPLENKRELKLFVNIKEEVKFNLPSQYKKYIEDLYLSSFIRK